MTPSVRWINIAAIALCLSGCLGSAPATRLYMLEPMTEPATAVKTAKPLAVIVREVRLPHYLDRPQIVTRDSSHRLQLAELDQWGGELREDMTRILAGNLGRLLGSDRVFSSPLNVAFQPDYRLEVEVLHFERTPEGRVQFAARWWLVRGADAKLLDSREASLSAVPSSDTYAALVSAMSTVYGEFARTVADHIRQAHGI